jgi:hypothetical protein
VNVKKHLPASAVAAARLARTVATVRGLRDPQERRLREEALRRMRAQPLAAAAGRRVLIFSFRGGWYPHAAWETLIGHALRLRGAAVHIFNCGGPMPICEVNFRHASPAVACTECASYPATLVRGLGMERTWLRDYLTPAEAREIDEAVERLDPDAYDAWEHADRPIGALVRDSTLWFLKKSQILTDDDRKIQRDFLRSGARLATALPRLIERINPDVVLELNGRFFAERILNSFVPDPVPIVVYEAGWRTNTAGFDRLRTYGLMDLDDAWRDYQEVPLTAQEESELDAWMTSRTAGDMQRDFYIRFHGASETSVLGSLGLDETRPTAVLFTNVVWDTAVLGRDLGFRSISHWVQSTIAQFGARPDWQLIVRIHPAEDLRPSQEAVEKVSDAVRAMGVLPANVRLVGSRASVNSYALIERARAVLAYTSTAGLEAALRGRPVALAAQVYYRGRGFTADIAGPDDYPQVLESVMAGHGADTATIVRARRFAYLLLFRYLRRLPVVQQRPGQIPLLDPAEVNALMPGNAPDFDELAAAIWKGGPFVPPPPRSV